jgi:type IV pilus assembly protein PilO
MVRGWSAPRPVLGLAAALAVLVLDWRWLVEPRWTALAAARERLAALRAELVAARREVATRADTRHAVRETARALRRAAMRLPDQRQLSTLLATVAEGARDARLELVRLRPTAERRASDHVEVPVELEMRGTYLEVVEFLRRLDGLGRLVRVGDLRLEHPEGTGDRVVVQMRCTALTYRLLDPAARAGRRQ